MKTIYHILTANRLHLVPQLIKSYQSRVHSVNHVFILWKCNSDNIELYNTIAREYNAISSFVYANETKQLKEAIPSTGAIIVIHSFIIECTLYLMMHGYKNVNAVCWGDGVKVSSIRHILLFPVKLVIYHYYNYIITLMEPDGISLRKYYKKSKVVTIPYIGERELLLDSYKPQPKYTSNLIYVGNNYNCIDSYLYAANKLLWNFKDNLSIELMLNYDVKNDIRIADLQNILESYSDAKINTTFYNLQNYIQYMDKCAIYICADDRQTGLAAIYTCLRLGKKIYLSGKNYDWIKSLGGIVYHVECLNHISMDELLSPLTEEEKNINYRVVKDLENTQHKIDKWNNFFERL